MHINRIASFWNEPTERPKPPANPSPGFIFCPIILISAPWQQQIYHFAYEQAKTEVEKTRSGAMPSLECWN